MTVWIYVDTNKQVGDPEHLKVFANQETAESMVRGERPGRRGLRIRGERFWIRKVMSTPIHYSPVLLFVVLAGCYSDQRQQLAVCKMELRGKVFSANPEIQAKAETDTLELCMNARGYEVVENDCTVGRSSLGHQSGDYVELRQEDNCA